MKQPYIKGRFGEGRTMAEVIRDEAFGCCCYLPLERGHDLLCRAHPRRGLFRSQDRTRSLRRSVKEAVE